MKAAAYCASLETSGATIQDQRRYLPSVQEWGTYVQGRAEGLYEAMLNGRAETIQER